MIPITIYSGPGCHLCDEMKALVARVAQTKPLRSPRSTSPPILRSKRYTDSRFPCLMVAGKKAAKYRIAEDELRRGLLNATTERLTRGAIPRAADMPA